MGKGCKIIGAIAVTAAIAAVIGIVVKNNISHSDNTSDMDYSIQNQANDGNTAAEETNDAGKIVAILFSRAESDIAMETGIINMAGNAGYEVTSYTVWSNAERQISLAENAAASGAKAIIVDPADPDAAQSIAEIANAYPDIPIVFMNRMPSNRELLCAENIAYCGYDKDKEGYCQGEYLVSYFQSRGKTDIHCIMLQGESDTAAQAKWSAGVLQALQDNGINAASVVNLGGGGDRDTACKQLMPILASGKSFDCIIANDDEMALGAIQACKENGIDPSAFPIVGFGCSEEGAEAVKDGILAMTVFQNDERIGKGAAQAAINLINGDAASLYTSYNADDSGESYSDSIIWIPYQTVTANNVINYLNR